MRKWNCSDNVKLVAGPGIVQATLTVIGTGQPDADAGLLDSAVAAAMAKVAKSQAAKSAAATARQVEAAQAELSTVSAALDAAKTRKQNFIEAGKLDDAEVADEQVRAIARKYAVQHERLTYLESQAAAAEKALAGEKQAALTEAHRETHRMATDLKREATESIAEAVTRGMEMLLRANRAFDDLRAANEADVAKRVQPFRPAPERPPVAVGAI
jgi:hypothetical protein